MKKKCTFLGLALSFLILSGIINAQKIEEKEFYKNNPQLGGEVIIESSITEVINNENYITFSVKSASEGDFYINFWLIPAKLKNNSYSNYKVLVNGIFVGNIIPQKGNWQTIGLSNNKKIKLNSGNNTVSIVAQMPEVPAVEFVRLSKHLSGALISSMEYDNYLNDAKASANNKIRNNNGLKFSGFSLNGDTLNAITTMSSGTSVWYNIPQKYTFYKILKFYAGQEIFVTSTSKTLHVLEFFQVANAKSYSWVHRAEYAVNGGNYVARIKVTIPEDASYYVRVRTYYNGTQSIADVNVNGTHYYENVPIYTYGVTKQQGGNNNYYATYTNGSNHRPFLSIQESQSERIVAYNCGVTSIEDRHYSAPYGLSKYDSFIRDSYYMPTQAVLLTAWSSGLTYTNCTLYAGVPMSATRSLSLNEDVETRDATSNVQTELSQIKIYPNPAKLNSEININSDDLIERIDIYNLSGQKLQSLVINQNQTKLSLSDMNISQAGMYILKIKTVSGIQTQKVMVN